MATEVVMEALSPTMEEGRLVEWKKQEGDAVTTGDVLADVETDKAVMELVARADGVLLRQVVAAGDTVPVSSTVGWIGAEGEALPEGDTDTAPPTKAEAEPDAEPDAKPDAKPAAKQAEAPQDGKAKAARSTVAAPAAAAVPVRQPATGARMRSSPLARRIAAERGIDIATVAGSGPEGRVIKRDLDQVAAAVPGRATVPAGPPFADVPLSQIRKTIAKRLVQSIGPIPTFYLTTEVDMERAADLREQLTAALGDEGKVSYNDIVIRAVGLSLTAHRACNAWWQDDHIRYWNHVHVGMAVAVEDGLITPVIRHANAKSLREIGAESRDLAARARARRLTPEEYTGATCTISNLGMYDIEHFTAVINPPEAAILAIGSIATVPAVVGGAVVPRRRMRVTMSCDHRVIDGATGAEFLKTLKRYLENPVALVAGV